MDAQFSLACNWLAEAFRYPAPGHLSRLDQGIESLKAGDERQCLADFLGKVRRLTLGEWEELHTRTLDLNPPAAPYVGFQTWGESYQRGEFLAKMSREILENGIDADGELPDHLIPILRYLAISPAPLAGLLEHLSPAIQRMSAGLRQADPANPYLSLFECAQILTKSALKEPA